MPSFPISHALFAALVVAAAVPAIAQTSSRGGSRGSSIGQSNPGTQDINRTIDPNQTRSLPGAPAPGSTTLQTQSLGTNTVNTPLAPNSNGMGQTLPSTSSKAPTLGTGTSGAIGAPGTTTTTGTTSAPGTTTAPGAAISSSAMIHQLHVKNRNEI